MASETAVLTRQSSALSMREISTLCDRLEVRAQHRDQPLVGDDPASIDPLGDDLRLAAGSLRALVRSFHLSDVITIEE